jgi:hypothetical protein
VKIAYHKNQAKVFDSDYRFKVIACGRRWGKTRGAISWIVERLTETESHQLGWWVAPTYQQAKIAFRYFEKLFPTGIIERKNLSELRIEFTVGSVLEFKTADKPDNLRGEGVNYLVLDECGVMNGDVWYEVLRPALMDTHGMACFIGTPKGKNFFHELYLKGKDKLEPDFNSWTFSSYDNSTIPDIIKEIDNAKQEMPEKLFEQEIMAIFHDDLGGVFRNVDGCTSGEYTDPVHKREYFIGVDLAKYNDFTVICVICKKTKSLVAFDRFNKVDWSIQEKRILEMGDKYNKADILIDRGQVGDRVLENLQRRYEGKVDGIMFNNTNKTEMINKLSNLIEKGLIKYPHENVTLRDELKNYGYELLPSGKLRMNAPSGYHDDCVIALGLACWDLEMEHGLPVEFYEAGTRTFGNSGIEGISDFTDDENDGRIFY